MGKVRPWLDRALPHIVVSEKGCWDWSRGKTTGYGRIYDGDNAALLHRLMYVEYVGPIPDGYEVDHLCRNRACCCPEHLEAVPKAENNRRSESLSARNSRKTHCLNGHELAGDNLYIRKDGTGRECRACKGYAGPRRRATHCKRGHNLDENSYLTANGARQCRVCVTICRRERKRAAH